MPGHFSQAPQKRRSRIASASETWYNYTIGFDVVSTEDDADGGYGAPCCLK